MVQYISGYYTYEINTRGNATIVKCEDTESDSIKIPHKVGEEPNIYIVDEISGTTFPQGWYYNVTEITIPDTVIKLGDGIFQCCDFLQVINIGSGLRSLTENTFSCIYAPSGPRYTGCSQINISQDNQHFSSENGILFNKDKTELIKFPQNHRLTEYVIPDTVIKVWSTAFDVLYALEKITIGKNVEQFSDLDYYDSLSRINVDKDNNYFYSENNILFNKDKTELIKYPYCQSDSNYTIPNTVKTICRDAFEHNQHITVVKMGSNVNLIESGAFGDCQQLYRVVFKNSPLTIERSAFYDCMDLGYIHFQGTMPQRNTLIDNKTFKIAGYAREYSEEHDYQGNKYLLTNNWYYDYEYVRNCFKVKFTVQCDEDHQLTGPGSATIIDYDPKNPPVGDVIINSSYMLSGHSYSVISIESSVIQSWNNVTSITIPETINWIGANNFRSCNNLTSVIIPDSVIYIGNNSCVSCSNLKGITLSNNLSHIGDGFGKGCPNVKEISIPSGVTSIGIDFFNDAQSGLQKIDVDDANVNYSSRDGVLYNKNQTELIKYPRAKEGALENSFTIIDGVETIRNYAFDYCNLKTINISKTVKNVYECSFWYCYNLQMLVVDDDSNYFSSKDGILFNKNQTILYQCPINHNTTQYTVPDSVIQIRKHAFTHNNNITDVIIPSSVTYIGYEGFSYTDSIKNVEFNSINLTLDTSSFRNSKQLTTIRINSGKINVGNNAFLSCTRLSDIYYKGTKSQKNALLTISTTGNTNLLNSKWHYSLNGKVKTKDGLKEITNAYIIKNGERVLICDLRYSNIN